MIKLLIYRIISEKEWNENKNKQIYEPEELARDGFIHFSLKNQLIDVANAVYQEYEKLIVLEVDTEKLTHPESLKIEDLYHYGVDYPHLYSPLNLSAIVAQFEMVHLETGFQFNLD